MAPITYRGGLHGDLVVVGQDEDGPVYESDVYRGYDSAGQPLHLEVGETVDVDADTAARIAEDHGPFFEIDGKVGVAAKPVDEKTIDEMTGAELDAFAAELEVADWNPKAKVAAKKETLTAAVAAKLDEAMGGTGDDQLRAELLQTDREQLNAIATEMGIEDADTVETVEELVEAMLAKKAEQ